MAKKKKDDGGPLLVTVTEYAEHRGVSSSRISELKRQGRLVLVHGQIDQAASDEALDGPEGVTTWDGDEVPIDADRGEAERIKTIWAARKMRAEVLEATGELVSKEKVEQVCFDLVRAARDKLQTIGLRVADPVMAMEEKAEVVAKIDEEIDLALEDLSARIGGAGRRD